MKDRTPLNGRLVLLTELPLIVMREIARYLGAQLLDWGAWVAPDVDQSIWQHRFAMTEREYERRILKNAEENMAAKRVLTRLYQLDIETFRKKLLIH